jgi:hypothetical protein
LNLQVFDFQQPAACELWAGTCIQATQTGVVDGCFADRAIDTQKFETSGQITPAQRAAFDKGHWDMLSRLQTTIGAGPIVANHAYNLSGVGAAMIEFGKADVTTVKDIQMSAANGKVTLAHFNRLNDDTVATFLVGAGNNSFIGAGGWSISGQQLGEVAHRWLPQYYERPLGQPLSDAVLSTGPDGNKTYTRKFSRGTNVTLNCFRHGGCRGEIAWGGPAPGQPPEPVPQPTASCPVVNSSCSWQHADLGPFRTVQHW